MNMPRQSFWTVGAIKKTFGLPAEGVPHLASYFALMSKTAALL